MWKLTLRNVTKFRAPSSQIFPISSPFKNCQSIWGNVLRIDFPIYIFHSFSCSGKSRLTCVWLLGKKKRYGKKKLRRSVKMVVLSGQLFIDFAWVILVFGRVARVMIFFEWTTLNVRAFLECLACLGLLSSWTQKKWTNTLVFSSIFCTQYHPHV